MSTTKCGLNGKLDLSVLALLKPFQCWKSMVSTFQVKSEEMKVMWMRGYRPPGGCSHPPQQGDHLQGEYHRMTGVCHRTEGCHPTWRIDRHLQEEGRGLGLQEVGGPGLLGAEDPGLQGGENHVLPKGDHSLQDIEVQDQQLDHLQLEGEYHRLTGVCHQTEGGGHLTWRGGRHLHLLGTINKEQRMFKNKGEITVCKKIFQE